MTQLRKYSGINRYRLKRFRFRAAQRAAKEQKRRERAAREEPLPDVSHVRVPRLKPSGFRVVVICLDDGERVQFTAARTPWGELSVSPSRAGQKVACVLANYLPKGRRV